jgi:hypothetical protein
MALTSPKMGLRIWDSLSDPYDHNQLADNWSKVDFHDHTPGRGVQIPTEGIADGAITSVKMAASIDPAGSYTMWKPFLRGLGTIPASTGAGTYGLSPTRPSAAAVTATTSGVFLFDPADYTVSGRTTKIRVLGTISTLTATAPGVAIGIGIVPVTAITAGVLTAGAGVTTNTVTPAGNTLNFVVAPEVNAPAAGFYVLVATTAGTTAVGSSIEISAQLEVRQV